LKPNFEINQESLSFQHFAAWRLYVMNYSGYNL